MSAQLGRPQAPMRFWNMTPAPAPNRDRDRPEYMLGQGRTTPNANTVPRFMPYTQHRPGRRTTPDPYRPNGLYQPSRGAQRDAKWLAKMGGTRGPSSSSRQGEAERRRRELAQQQEQAVARWELDKRRRAVELERRRNMRRIQLQVFVHARATPCQWKGCEAILNSWALLEKHLHHAHLHPSIALRCGSRSVACQWSLCEERFGSVGECEAHGLRDHMGRYSGRCPSNCLFEGETFGALLAHMSRRHANTSSKDFVPGLIHQPPPDLPSFSDLPPIPKGISPIEPLPCQEFTLAPAPKKPLEVFPGKAGVSAQREVKFGCWGESRETRELWIKQRGALAAIGAIITNAKRANFGVITAGYGGEVIDVVATRKAAEKAARGRFSRAHLLESRSRSLGYSSDSSSTSASRPRPRRGMTSLTMDMEKRIGTRARSATADIEGAAQGST